MNVRHVLGRYPAETSAHAVVDHNKSEADRSISDDTMQYDMGISRLSSGPQTAQTQTQIAQLQSQRLRLQNRLRGTDSMSISSSAADW